MEDYPIETNLTKTNNPKFTRGLRTFLKSSLHKIHEDNDNDFSDNNSNQEENEEKEITEPKINFEVNAIPKKQNNIEEIIITRKPKFTSNYKKIRKSEVDINDLTIKNIIKPKERFINNDNDNINKTQDYLYDRNNNPKKIRLSHSFCDLNRENFSTIENKNNTIDTMVISNIPQFEKNVQKFNSEKKYISEQRMKTAYQKPNVTYLSSNSNDIIRNNIDINSNKNINNNKFNADKLKTNEDIKETLLILLNKIKVLKDKQEFLISEDKFHRQKIMERNAKINQIIKRTFNFLINFNRIMNNKNQQIKQEIINNLNLFFED